MTTNGNRNPEDIEAEIQETRARVDDTINAIQGKLSPSQIMEQTVDYFRNNAPSDLISNLGRTIKQNPVPIALIGAGIAWLILSDHDRKALGRPSTISADDYDDWNTTRIGAENYPSETGTDGMRHTLDEIKANAKTLSENVQHKARDVAQSARESISRMTHDTPVSGDKLSYQARQAKGRFMHMIEEQPLVIGALGMALGALLGAGLPSTRREDELMGKARDELVDKATQMGQDQLEKAKSTLHTAKENILRETGRVASEGLKT